jgi:8-amino-7-oxononanoate synthase
VPDFTSALYLGIRHESRSLGAWSQLTTGAPAALREPPGAEEVAQELAGLMGCDRATLSPSTLHLFWDLLGGLREDSFTIYWDSGLYPIARWGVERAAARGAPAHRFPHHDPEALRCRLKVALRARQRPVVVTDGFCPGCGRGAPLQEYLEALTPYGGRLVLDDTQALGIFGASPSVSAPYGRAGGGSLVHQGVSGPTVLVGASLAKGFGVPVAVLAGSEETVRLFKDRSETRVHCSPPSAAAVHGAARAVAVNARMGDRLRLRLAQVVSHFRSLLQDAGLSALGGSFPVQRVRVGSDAAVSTVHQRLRRAGVQAVAQRSPCQAGATVTFLLTARHQAREVEQGVAALAAAVRGRVASHGRREERDEPALRDGSGRA